jgi:hypothetical protein
LNQNSGTAYMIPFQRRLGFARIYHSSPTRGRKDVKIQIPK